MPAPDYRQRFLVLVDALEDNRRISLDNYVFGDPLSEAEIARLEKKHKARLPPAARRFFAQMNGFVLDWYLPKRARIKHHTPKFPDELWGSVHIQPLDTLLGGPDGNGWHDILWFDHLDARTKAQRKELRPFDLYDLNDANAACFRLRRGRLADDLVLHSIDDGVRPLCVGVASYLEALLASRGLIGWQEAWAYPGGLERERLLHYLPQLFPDADPRTFPALDDGS